MSYARWGPDSDVYVYESDGWECCGCELIHHGTDCFATLSALSDHLKEHEKAGHKVPQDCWDRIEYEHRTGCGLLSGEPVPWDEAMREFLYED